MAKRRSSPALFELLDDRPDPRPDPKPNPKPGPKPDPKPVPNPESKSEPSPSESRTADRATPTSAKAPSTPSAPQTPKQATPTSSGSWSPRAQSSVPVVVPPSPPSGSPVPDLATVPSTHADAEPQSEDLAEPHEPRMVRVSPVSISYALTGALAIGIIGYLIGYRSGVANEAEQWAAEANVPRMTEPEIPFDPLLVDPMTSPEPDVPRRSEESTSSEPATPDQTASASTGGTLAINAERRTPGLNYLVLGMLQDRAEAERLAVFLESRDIAAQVERVSGSRASGWRVLTLHGITGREYARSLPARTDHEREVERAGRAWLDEAEGTLDFTKPERRLWTKYDP